MLDEAGNSVVTVKRDELLQVLKKNRDGHRKEFLDAQEGYRVAVIKELDVMLDEARKGKRIRRAVHLEEPQDHTKDYDRVIRMLEMSVNDEIKVSEREFQQYVMDEWGWMESFKNVSQTYGGNRR